MPYTAVQSMVDDGAPPGLRNYVKSEWLARLDDSAIDHIVSAAAAPTSPLSQVLLRQMGGAIARVPAEDAAFSYREAALILTVPAVWASPNEDPAPHVNWARTLWSDLQPASVERGPYQVVEHGDLRALLRQALQTLPVTLRTAVILRDLHELSYQEIADQLGLPEGTVKSRINRGRIELARQLRRLQDKQPAHRRRRGAPTRGRTKSTRSAE